MAQYMFWKSTHPHGAGCAVEKSLVIIFGELVTTDLSGKLSDQADYIKLPLKTLAHKKAPTGGASCLAFGN